MNELACDEPYIETFDVALWRFWPALFADHVAYVDEIDPLSAVAALMRAHDLHYVQRAAISLKGGVLISRYTRIFLTEEKIIARYIEE